VISRALSSTAVPNDALQLVTTRDAIKPLLALDQYIDLVIPRGGNELVRSVKQGTQIPVLGHADGLCAAYLRADCPEAMAVNVIVDSKTSYPAACNSLETLLVDEKALSTILTPVASALLRKGVSLRCDAKAKAALSSSLEKHDALLIQDVSEEDYRTEFLDLILAIKTIPDTSDPQDALDFAINHINEYGSHHTDAILTLDENAARHFQEAVDSAGVFWNTSTRMADGQRFGFGTEVGISTNKIHARGPVGLEGLCIYRWRIDGRGQTTAEYGAGKKQWKHQTLPVGDVERVAVDDDELGMLRKYRALKGKLSNGPKGTNGTT
jgi:glutamate-5-semialdehyde dehydrogenase